MLVAHMGVPFKYHRGAVLRRLAHDGWVVTFGTPYLVLSVLY